MQAKRDVGIKTIKWPRYSPDLNPLDFSFWKQLDRRMDEGAPKGWVRHLLLLSARNFPHSSNCVRGGCVLFVWRFEGKGGGADAKVVVVWVLCRRPDQL